MKRITGRLAEDKGKYYAVINLPNTDGKRKTKWHSLNLEVKKGNKKEAQHRLNQILDKYNAGDLYLAKTMTHAEQERNKKHQNAVAEALLNRFKIIGIKAHHIADLVSMIILL